MFWPFGTLLGPSEPFGTISNKKWFFWSKATPPNPTLNKLIFCLKWSKSVQMGPKRSQKKITSRFTISTLLDPFGLLWTSLECWQAWHVWPFLFVLLVHFLGHPVDLTVLWSPMNQSSLAVYNTSLPIEHNTIILHNESWSLVRMMRMVKMVAGLLSGIRMLVISGE